MKRRLFKLVVFLLLGAFVNVAVAWGCAAWIDVYTSEDRGDMSNTVANGWWDLMRHSKTGATAAVLLRRGDFNEGPDEWDEKELRELLPSWGNLRISASAPGQAIDGRGWPAVCLWSEFEPVDSGAVTEVRGGVVIPLASRFHPYMGSDVPRVLPLRPIWPGFAINTAFYAVALWLLLFSLSIVRRNARFERGRCPRCGYNLRGDFAAGCSECGWRREEPHG